MTIRRTLVCLTMLAALGGAPLLAADITVWLNPASPSVAVGDTVDVDIMASFSESVVGWGIDLALDEPGYADWIDTVIGSAWDPSDTLDHDGLAGLRLPPGVGGDVLLATVTFAGIAPGTTTLTLSTGPEEDEGFLLEAGDWVTEAEFLPGTLTVVPEPTALTLLALAALTTLRRR
ncbi:MAG: hypothetical protein PVJ57_21600 [Phycisphaerae bacterium]|jgi:hypothetical protein